MVQTVESDICIIGAGAGGLSVAAGAQQLGYQVALVESHKMGGDCLNYGCIPSKSFIACAKMAYQAKHMHNFGLPPVAIDVNLEKVMKHVQSVIETIAPHDSIERFEKLGVKVIKAAGKFIDKTILEANDTLIKSKYFVIATGSFPFVPKIPGIETVPYYTNETIFNLKEFPSELIILGGGPIGCELAQAFLFLGVKTTLIEAINLLPHDEPDLVEMLRQQLIQQGLVLFEEAKVQTIGENDGTIRVVISQQNSQKVIEGSHILVATGRKPNLHKLNLEVAGVNYSDKGIEVNASLRTSSPNIYAVGDVVGSYQFTHMASYHAQVVIKNILFKLPAKAATHAVPWVTYTSPELAHVGMSSKEAIEKYPNAKIVSVPLSANDRAQTEGETVGQIKVVTTAKGKILGATILAAHAGELILPWIMAIQQNQFIRSLTSVIVPYPTLGEISKSAASEYYKPVVFSKKMKMLVKFLKYFNQ